MSKAFECVENGARARAAVDGLQHRGLDLEVAVTGERRAQRRDRRGPCPHRDARLLAGDEVEVALPHAGLVAQLGVQVRQRQDRLGRDRPVGDQDAEFPAPRRDHLTADEDVIAQVDEFLPAADGLLAHLGQAHHRLDALAAARLQRREAELAGVAAEDDTAGQSDEIVGGVVGDELAVLRAHRGDRGRDRQGDRVRLAALGDQPRPLLETDGLLLGDRFGCRLGLEALGGGPSQGHALLSSDRWRRCRSGGPSPPGPRSRRARGPGSRHRRAGRSSGSRPSGTPA